MSLRIEIAEATERLDVEFNKDNIVHNVAGELLKESEIRGGYAERVCQALRDGTEVLQHRHDEIKHAQALFIR